MTYFELLDLRSLESTEGVNTESDTTGALWSTDTWTGAGEQNAYQYVTTSLQTDEAGTLFYDFSVDGTNWGTFPVAGFAVSPGIHEYHAAHKSGRYFRPRFVGTGGRSYFRLHTCYSNTQAQLNAPLNQSIASDSDASTVKAIIAGLKPDGLNFANVPVNNQGNLITGDFLTEVAKGNVSGHSLVNKFGRNDDVDSGSVPEDIWAAGGVYTFAAAAQTLNVSSGSVLDTSAGTGARTVTIQGLNASYAEIEETVTLNGVVPVTTTNSFLRTNRAFVATGGTLGANQGAITVAQTISATTMLAIPIGDNQSQLGIYTVPAGKTGYILNSVISASKGSNSSVTGTLMIRETGGLFRTRDNFDAHSAGFASVINYSAPIVVEAQSDIVYRVTSVSANNTQISVRFSILLVDD